MSCREGRFEPAEEDQRIAGELRLELEAVRNPCAGRTAPYDAFSEIYDAVNYDTVNTENYDGVNLRHHTRKKFRCGLSWWLLTLKHT